MDSNTRALIVAISTDFYYCIFCPALVLYACPSVRRNLRTASTIWTQVPPTTTIAREQPSS